MAAAAGIDLAPRHSAICVIPDKWDGSIDTLQSTCFEFGQLGKLDVDARIQLAVVAADMVVSFCEERKVTSVGVENYAFRRGMSQSATMLAEIGGIVRSQFLLNFGWCPEEINAASARKFITGGVRMKRKTDNANGVKVLPIKDQIGLFLRNRGFLFDQEDTMDAFVVAYYLYCRNNSLKCSFDKIRPNEQTAKVRQRSE